jgi:hypothetical protein
MSLKGVRQTAKLLTDLQQTRIELIAGDAQDRALSGMLLKAHNAMGLDFALITSDPKLDASAREDQARRDLAIREFRRWPHFFSR